jgi:alkylation response protein AidB-like acyl-CoA dehydrogenase
MNFETDIADKEFRRKTRAFLRSKLQELFGPSWSERVFEPDAQRLWTRALNAGGYLVPHWPEEWGGSNWPVTWPHIMEQELSLAQTPNVDTIGLGFVGPMLCKYGSPQQKRRYLQRIRNADDIWCQGFSEPGAGSDTMSLTTTAVRHKDGFRVNGRKLWITGAHYANMMFTLVRIQLPEGRREGGLTFLLINMRDPGLKVRPVIMIDGSHRLNEVTLENVHVTLDDMVGEQGKGWVYARSLLADERAIVAGLGQVRFLLNSLRQILASESCNGCPLMEDPKYYLPFIKMLAELKALEFMELRRLHDKSTNSSHASFTPILKLRGCELRQRVTELAVQALGESALETPQSAGAGLGVLDPPRRIGLMTRRFLFERSATIAGGTSEIQRNIIAAVELGL